MNSQTAALVERLKAELERHDTLWNEPDKQLWTNVSRITVGDMRVLLAALADAPVPPATEEKTDESELTRELFEYLATAPAPQGETELRTKILELQEQLEIYREALTGHPWRLCNCGRIKEDGWLPPISHTETCNYRLLTLPAAPVPALREQEELADALMLWADQLASEGRDGPYQVMRKAAKLLRVQSFIPEGT